METKKQFLINWYEHTQIKSLGTKQGNYISRYERGYGVTETMTSK